MRLITIITNNLTALRPLTQHNRILSHYSAGALDTRTVNIVPKSSSKNGRYQNQSIIKCISKPFEQTFRLQVRSLRFQSYCFRGKNVHFLKKIIVPLQVHLPRNQLYVARISPKTQLNSILKQVCFEKNLDSAKYTLRKPGMFVSHFSFLLPIKIIYTISCDDYKMTRVQCKIRREIIFFQF